MEIETVNTLTEQCHAAIAALERAHTAPPIQFTQETDFAMRSIVAIRDLLIAQVRAGDNTARTALDQGNIALSIVVGLEYPAAGIMRENTVHARGALEQALGLLKDPKGF